MNRLKDLPPSHRKPWVQKTLGYEKFSYGLSLRTPLFPPSTFYCFTFSPLLTGKVATESISLELPADVVPDSFKAYVTVLGKQLKNLGSKRQNGARGCQGVEWGGHVNLSEGRCGGLEVTKGKSLFYIVGSTAST